MPPRATKNVKKAARPRFRPRDQYDTRRRIVEAARQAFADRGYAGTTNQDVANLTGLSSAAMYYYYESKLELFLAVAEENEQVILSEFRRVAHEEEALVDTFARVVEAALTLHEHDPTRANFTASSAVDLQRHPEIKQAAAARGIGAGYAAFWPELLADARAQGQVLADLSDVAILGMIHAFLTGIAHMAIEADLSDLRATADGATRLLSGLIAPASASAYPARSGRNQPQ